MLDNRTRYLLSTRGLSVREIRDVEFPVLHLIPDDSRGCGLSGATGRGKTVAMAQHLARKIAQIVSERGPEAMLPNRFAMWAHWPDTADRIKSLSGYSNWAQLDELIEQLELCSWLYLDDIGQERIRGDDDFSLSHVRNIIDARYRSDLPIFWTTNLTRDDMVRVYGARTISRMLEAWPAVKVGGDDMRLKKPV